jgi:uncharacterized protein YrrD
MTSLREAVGKPVIVRETAEQAGEVRAFAVDAPAHRVTTLVVASGRSARLVDWDEIESIGPDAIIVRSTREAADDDRLASGALHPLDKRVLSDAGNELGAVRDVTVDESGSINAVDAGDASVAGSRLRGIGSYALVVTADPSER